MLLKIARTLAVPREPTTLTVSPGFSFMGLLLFLLFPLMAEPGQWNKIGSVIFGPNTIPSAVAIQSGDSGFGRKTEEFGAR
jgi:hypothetical protein